MRNVCVHTNFTCGSGDSSTSNHSHHGQYSQGAVAPFRGVSNGGSSLRGSSDSIGSSRGSTGGMRMSSGPDLAGVGIFFQQEPNTGKVYVANIVENGSADRSGVICVNDVIVKVDNDDVQGQPLSMLRNLILGKQGSYVVLAFRRMTGSELYYFDVELLRGSPEYFESLKKSQQAADEKEKLLMQVRQQEQDIRALRQHSATTTPTKTPASEGPGADIESIQRAIANQSEEIARMESELNRERGQMASSTGAAEQQLVQLRAENKRLGDKLAIETKKLNELKARGQEQAEEWAEQRQRLQAALQAEIGAANSTQVQNPSTLEAENSRLREELRALDQRDERAKQALLQAQQTLEEVTRNNESNLQLLQEILPSVTSTFGSLFGVHGVTVSQPPSFT